MPREDISLQTSDNVTLRGWFYTPETGSTTHCHVWYCRMASQPSKGTYLDKYAEYFISSLPISVLVYDHCGFGASDTHPSSPCEQIIVSLQIAVWGVALNGGHALRVGAVDRRIKAVLSQVPMLNGWENFQRLTSPNSVAGLNSLFQQDRLARAAGKAAITIPVSDLDPAANSALQGVEAHEFFEKLGKGTPWKNEVTIKTMEEFRSYNLWFESQHISPTPLLLTNAEKDTLMPTDLSLAAYARALEPKELQILSGGHFGGYCQHFETVAKRQADFLKKTLYI